MSPAAAVTLCDWLSSDRSHQAVDSTEPDSFGIFFNFAVHWYHRHYQSSSLVFDSLKETRLQIIKFECMNSSSALSSKKPRQSVLSEYSIPDIHGSEPAVFPSLSGRR